MEIQQLIYVVRAAEQMNFSKASELCCVTQSCLSQQIAKLEDEIGVKIFERTTRQVSLTEQGERFVQQAHKVLADVDLLNVSLHPVEEDVQGTLKIGTIGSMATGEFSRMIAGFHAQYPCVKINLIQAGSLELQDMLRTGTVDVSFMASYADESLSEFDTTPISLFSYFLAVPKGHRFAQRMYVKMEELSEENFVFHDQNLAMHHICLKACRNAGFEPNIVCTTTHTWFRYYMVEAGLGIGFFTYEDFLSFPVNRVSRLRIQPSIESMLMMASLKQKHPDPIVGAFRTFVESWFQTHRSGLNEVLHLQDTVR